MSDPGKLIDAAICHLRVALTAVDPDSPNAAAPMKEPPSDWHFPADLWHPLFRDPRAALKDANDFINLAYVLIEHPSGSCFDDAAPSGSASGEAL